MLNHKIDQMKEELQLFSKTQEKEHLEDALKMKAKLMEDNKLDLSESL